MWLILLICCPLMSFTARPRLNLCDIRTHEQFERMSNCTHLRLSVDDDRIMQHPNLFEKLRTVTTILKLKLFNTSLTQITDAQLVELPKDSSLDIFDNPLLEKLPNFTIVDGRRVKLFILNNHRLDTSQLLEECKKKRCDPGTFRTIQMPFSKSICLRYRQIRRFEIDTIVAACSYRQPLPYDCRFIFDNIDLKETDNRSLDQIEVVYGTLTLRGSNLTSFPRLKNLRQLGQNSGMPMLVIENNPKLTDLTALFELNMKVDDMRTAIAISGNPKLCIGKKQAKEPFVIKYLTTVDSCSTFLVIYFTESQ
ncbi:receptor L domain protein [Necator americanus]|uniref:Receptor L domain protein n=1 Tax=Necator americanus TaxID=51031 RepID=W2TK86_NECAM|nr:receptor L domain protein [Necator americanus]ETN82490.1 receptor L domain protein [Necator americanus]